jgi:hypothetical protein
MSAIAKDQSAKSKPEKPSSDVSQQPTNDPKLSDADKTPGSGMVPDDAGDAPTG